MRGLYPIVDVDSVRAVELEVLEFAECVLAARPAAIQLRAKLFAAKETLELLRKLAPMCAAHGAALFANDRPDLALLAGCAGVHVGQRDLSASEVRRVTPGLKVGVSTHDLSQLEEALRDKPDYVAFGPVFATRSKENPDPVVGLEGLTRASELARAAGCPLVAIGGIDLERAPSVAQIAGSAAVIGALLPEDGDIDRVEDMARALNAALGGAA
jgi:thiamine-phosphate pyrophosphorylase